jgi:hypothetical protein
MALNAISTPIIDNINRALAPAPMGVKCCICGGDEVIHIGGIKDFWLCFKCHTRLIVVEEKK